MKSRDGICQSGRSRWPEPVVGKSIGCRIKAADAAKLSHPYVAARISIDADNVIRHQAVGNHRVVPVMRELATAFIEPVKSGAEATHPEITACISENAIHFTASAEPVLVLRAGNIMSDFPRFSIHSIQRAREEAYPQNAIGILVNRGNLAGRKTIWVRATMRKAPELFLLEVENIQPTILSAHPKQAGPITIDCHNAVVAKAMRVGFIVLKEACKSFCAPVKVRQAQARCHPESILSIIEEICCSPVGWRSRRAGIR